jgi:hypothetical protein
MRAINRWFRVVVVVAAVLSVGACSGSAPSANPATLGVEFTAKAAAACAAAEVRKQQHGTFPVANFDPRKPDPSVFPAILAYLKDDALRYDQWSAAMKALGGPTSGQDAWNALIAAINKHASIAHEQADAAARGDTATFTKDFEAGGKAQAELLDAASKAGLPDCAKLDR